MVFVFEIHHFLVWYENFEINDTQLTWNVEGLKLQPIMLVDIFI